MLTELDRLVQLIESPIFTFLRMEVIILEITVVDNLRILLSCLMGITS